MDFMNNFTNDPNRMAMLMAAAQMMAQSGPSARPVGIGEIIGGGMSTYLGTKNAMDAQQDEREQREQQKQYRGVQMQGLQMEQDKIRQSLARAQKVESVLRSRNNPVAGAMPQSPSMGSGSPSDQGSQVPTPHTGPAYSQEEAQAAFLAASKAGMSNDYDPERLNKIMVMARQGVPVDESARRLFGGGQQQPQPQESPYQRHMAAADALRNAGLETEALSYEDRALKFAPKVKNWQEVREGDSVRFAPFFEDGSHGAPVALELARKLEFRDGGGTNDGFDPYSGRKVASHGKTQSPDNIANNAVQMRGQNMVDARHAQEIAAGGKPPPGYRWTPDGALAAIPGGPGDKLPESQQKQVVGVNNLSNAITEYRDQLKQFGPTDIIRPDARAMMGTKYNNMMLQAKEAYNLGVLNGPDMEILQSVITNPSSMRGALTSRNALDSQASELDRIMQKVGQVSGRTRQPQQAVKKYNPATGRIE